MDVIGLIMLLRYCPNLVAEALVYKYNFIIKHTHIHADQICFETWGKLAQQWLVCVPLGRHLEPINKELMR